MVAENFYNIYFSSNVNTILQSKIISKCKNDKVPALPCTKTSPCTMLFKNLAPHSTYLSGLTSSFLETREISLRKIHFPP